MVFVAECVNIRTIFGLTRVSTFCVDVRNVLRVMEELLSSVRTEWAQEAILELVSAYGKGAVMPGDITVGVVTVVVEKGSVEFSAASEVGEDFVQGLRRICETHGFGFVATAA